ncbi:MAG: LysR family transcriptional regulator [Rhodospirillales bacterium CG15_BIG_FIL_POST_REV_8_21_14_020_66_15]|nr:MAG: LysR family transcriptional regulator [Rhodospirillales bacterium CG15_BIG_FIL_POST_REV_8_21_14_020_66_15]
MDINLARTFLAICEVGNFVKASERLYVTQSTVSTRVKLLEDLLGQPLFVRTKAGASLTAAGAQFRPYAEKLVQTWEQARHNVGLPTEFSTLLTVGAEFTLWERMLVSWMSWVRKALPAVALRAEVGTSDALMGHVVEGFIDLAVCYTPQHRSGVVVEQLAQDSLVLVSTDPATRGPRGAGYVFVDWGAEFRMEHLEAFPDLAASAMAVSYGPLAQQHILRAGGSAYLPLRAVRPRLEEGVLHMVEDAPVFRRPIFMVHLDGVDNPPFHTALEGLRQAALEEAGADREA